MDIHNILKGLNSYEYFSNVCVLSGMLRIIFEFSYTRTNIDKIMFIRRDFARNERI